MDLSTIRTTNNLVAVVPSADLAAQLESKAGFGTIKQSTQYLPLKVLYSFRNSDLALDPDDLVFVDSNAAARYSKEARLVCGVSVAMIPVKEIVAFTKITPTYRYVLDATDLDTSPW